MTIGGGLKLESKSRKERACEICRSHYPCLTKLAFSYLKNMFDAQDIVQEVFIAYIKTAPAFESEEHERAWLLRVTINKCKNHLKHQKFVSQGEPVHFEQPQTEHIEILSAVMSLPEKYRVPIHLYYYEDMSIAEIAELLHEKATTVGTRLARARTMLKDII